VTPIRVVSLFSGGGFAEEGLRLAAEATGIAVEVVMAVDSWLPAARVRDANFGGVRTTVRSVKEMTRDDLPAHDLVIGGPPCQPWSIAGQKRGASDPRDCLPDFQRLAAGSAWLMENVKSRLISDGWSEKFCAADFGDVTSRKRWFYSSHVLHVVPTPGPKRVRDIRDHDEDERILAKRAGCKAGNHSHFDDTLDTLDTLTAHSWHGHDVRGSGKLLKIGLRGNSASASAFEDDDVLGSILSNAYHANEASKLAGCRNPSVLEMARAHSIPDSWDWAGVTKGQRGQIIANGWCILTAKAVCTAMLQALVAERALAA
jgi:site-specific DNA-cytosine methylase